VFDELFSKYLSRLTALVRSRMAAKLARKIDPEDIVLSAFRSFFVATRDGRFEIEEENSLWQLLVTISLRKLGKHSDIFNSLKRSMDRETDSSSGLIATDPSPEEAAIIEDELCQMLSSLSVQDRKIVELRLQGWTLVEIANRLNISERTVRRVLKSIISEKRETEEPFNTSQLRIMKEMVTNHAPIDIPQGLLEESIDDYLIQRHVGVGGMGKVYLARRLADDEPVAIKFLKKRFLNTPQYVQQFLKEAVLLQDLDHPNIVQFHGVGKIRQRGIFIVMQWIDDATSLLHPKEALNLSEVVHVCLQAATGLLSAHNEGIVHCDVTPGNLLLQPDGKLMITDFGLARRTLETLNANQRAFGTIAFLAPEQASQEWGVISPKTDVYGLGATMYYLLTGSIPFPADSLPEMITDVISPKTPQRISELNITLSKSLEDLCMKCLKKEPEQRPELQIVMKMLQETSEAS